MSATNKPRTFADMTPDEIDQCAGMWVETQAFNQPRLAIFLDRLAQRNEAIILRTDNRQKFLTHLHKLTPRFDLPRAWTPAGDPVPGEWADGHMWWGEDSDTMQTVDLVGAECLTTGQVQGLGEWPEGVTPGEDVAVRRWVSDWEEA